MAIKRQATGPDIAPRAHQGGRDIVDTADDTVGDRGHCADEDDEQNGGFRQLKWQNRQGEPRDRRHGLQAGDERADRGPENAESGDRHTEG
jgi:hypothetical protein